ncbi:MAG: HAMP domain-containing histidine kinase [bacterium]|nr:HAMP domain-containing histidine kinase [bacterium]
MAVNSYRQLLESYRSHQDQLLAADDMREAQCRMLMSDSAASMGRLAAALSHELNNPLGALRSSVDTLRTVASREELPREKRAELEGRLWQTAEGSINRIHGIVRRIQRYTNLDRAEVLRLDINVLVTDVAEIVQQASEGTVRFELDTEALPELQGRPQALSAAFSGLLGDAARAVGDGGGTPRGMRISTRRGDGFVEVTVVDTEGQWLSGATEELEPSFGVRDGRMAACNWSLFSASQIVQEHGGELTVLSEAKAGSGVLVRLPAEAGSA